nr:hypothetical protein [Paracoccus sp. M09]
MLVGAPTAGDEGFAIDSNKAFLVHLAADAPGIISREIADFHVLDFHGDSVLIVWVVRFPNKRCSHFEVVPVSTVRPTQPL